MSDWNRIWQEIDRRIERRVGQVRGAVVLTIASLSRSAIQSLRGEALPDEELEVLLAQHYGFRSCPPAGQRVVLVQCLGRSGPMVAVAGMDPNAPTDLEEGEVAVYGPTGSRVLIKLDGSIEVTGSEVRLGSASAVDPVALATAVNAQLGQLSTAFTNWVPVPTDGGAALKTALTALQATGWPASTAATKVKAA